MKPPPPSTDVADTLETYPPQARQRLLELRALIFETAQQLEGVGALTETLKWGEPAYLTQRSKSGSTIRMGWRASRPEHYALYFICSTTLVTDFRVRFEGVLQFEDNRAIILSLDEPLAVEPLKECIGAALTYKLRKT